MQKIVINRCHGGFGLSERACAALNVKDYDDWAVKRDDPNLIALMEEKGAEWCEGSCSKLKIVQVPDGVDWTIEEYDGMEWVAERHRTWS